jgi:adenylate cyclase
VRRFATPEVAQDMQQSGFSLGGKRVHGSVLFSDIRGFTTLAESQPPEETIELLNTYYTLMFDAISGHGGIVSHIVGDGLMALFGAPVALPDHCDAAVRTALEMLELMDLFNVERQAAGKPAIRVGIGIASGEMVAGYTGTNERATYTCIGDTVNVAARLEQAAAPSTVVIGDGTYGRLPGAVAERLPPLYVKGKAQPLGAYRLDALGRSAGATKTNEQPREDDRNDEVDESPVPDPESKETDSDDDPEAD